jgi:microcystin-dependent protein
MRKIFTYIAFFLPLCIALSPVFAQTSIGMGTTTPDSHAVLDISSTTKGVLFPRLTTAQQTTLAGSLSAAEKGMMVTDSATGHLVVWTGTAWETPAAGTTYTADSPLVIKTNNLQINPGTQSGDLLTWDGDNWVNMQPAVQHFTVTVDNHQPYLVINYAIALYGVYPSQSDATTPFVGEVYMLGCNFAPVNWQLCDGSLISISENATLFNLLGTTYGGNGQTTYAVPDLRGRVPMHAGNNGTSSYIIGQTGGSETMTFSR